MQVLSGKIDYLSSWILNVLKRNQDLRMCEVGDTDIALLTKITRKGNLNIKKCEK